MKEIRRYITAGDQKSSRSLISGDYNQIKKGASKKDRVKEGKIEENVIKQCIIYFYY